MQLKNWSFRVVYYHTLLKSDIDIIVELEAQAGSFYTEMFLETTLAERLFVA